LLVSHDREFLTGIVTDIIDLRDKKLCYYRGNYETFEKGLELKKKQEEKEYKLKMKAIKEAQAAQTKDARDKKRKLRRTSEEKSRNLNLQKIILSIFSLRSHQS